VIDTVTLDHLQAGPALARPFFCAACAKFEVVRIFAYFLVTKRAAGLTIYGEKGQQPLLTVGDYLAGESLAGD
jgi:hypothetical protein